MIFGNKSQSGAMKIPLWLPVNTHHLQILQGWPLNAETLLSVYGLIN